MRPKIIKVFLIIVFIIAIIFTLYRYFYGTWNVFAEPDRIECYGRRYYKSNQTYHELMARAGTELPRYPVYSLNLLAGKMIYTSYPKGEFVPAMIYLREGNEEYVVYVLSGGP